MFRNMKRRTKVLKNDVLPILKKQTGFLEILPFMPEEKNGEDDYREPLGREEACRVVYAKSSQQWSGS
jgi:hypothetical protein